MEPQLMTPDQLMDFILANHEDRQSRLDTIEGFTIRRKIEALQDAERGYAELKSQLEEYVAGRLSAKVVQAKGTEPKKSVSRDGRTIIIDGGESTNEC